jgi:hypothetical protein
MHKKDKKPMPKKHKSEKERFGHEIGKTAGGSETEHPIYHRGLQRPKKPLKVVKKNRVKHAGEKD